LAVGDTVRDRISANAHIARLLESKLPPDEIIEQLYIRTLCRRPTPFEQTGLKELIGENISDPQAYEDIFWSLLNSTEFVFNH
jgi:hypothetical protein